MLSVIILAGGAAARMGQNKTLMPFLGEPLILRIIRRLQPLGGEVLINTNEPEVFKFTGLPLVPDLLPGQGALGGLYSALAVAANPYTAAVACDLPFCSPAILDYLHRQVFEMDLDGAVPVTGAGMYEPLHAVYRTAACREAVRSAIEGGQYRLISWFPQVKIGLVQPEDYQPLDPHGLAFFNVNTPEDFEKAEQLARQGNDYPG